MGARNVPRIRMLAQKAGGRLRFFLIRKAQLFRTGDLKASLHLKPGDILEFTVRGAKNIRSAIRWT